MDLVVLRLKRIMTKYEMVGVLMELLLFWFSVKGMLTK